MYQVFLYNRYMYVKYAVGFGVVILGLYLAIQRFVIWSPHNSPRKADEIKKPIYTSSQNSCAGLPIVMYHYVERVEDRSDTYRVRMSVHPRVFERQMKQLQHEGYIPIFVREIPDLVVNGDCTDRIALTFDDGYEDFYTDVFPILRMYGFRSTVYVIANYVNRKGFLSEGQLEELAASGLVEIGSHSMDHADMTKLSVSEWSAQITESRTVLSSIVGSPVVSFSYPLGKFSPVQALSVSGAGYTNAVTVEPGFMGNDKNVFEMPRFRPEAFFAPAGER